MKTRDLIFPLVVVPLGLAFVTMCILLYFRSNNKNLVRAKIRTGALLLSFSFFVSCGPPRVTCYEPLPTPNYVSLNLPDTLHPGDTLTGYIQSPNLPYYSAVITDSASGEKYLYPVLGSKGDSISGYNSRFDLVLDAGLKPGSYKVQVYGEKTRQVKKTQLLDEFSFIIFEKQPD
jgi:hypothetical protein